MKIQKSTIYQYFRCQTAMTLEARRPGVKTEELNLGIGCRDERLTGSFSHHDPEIGDLLEISVKEVIQPQVPLRLPCYDFAPVTALAFGRLVPCGF